MIKLKSKQTNKCFSYNIDNNGIGRPNQTHCDGIVLVLISGILNLSQEIFYQK